MRNDTPPSLASTRARINDVVVFGRVNGEGMPRLQGHVGCCWRGISMQTRGWEHGRFFRCGCSKKFECKNFRSFHFRMARNHTKCTKICTIPIYPSIRYLNLNKNAKINTRQINTRQINTRQMSCIYRIAGNFSELKISRFRQNWLENKCLRL